jgi:hypothetical protein
MARIDRICAGAIFLLAVVHGWTAGGARSARLWYFSAGLAMLFTAMLNLLRIRNGYGVRGLRMFCITANVTMSVFVASLIASIGWRRTWQNPVVPALMALLAIETVFSLGRNR